MKFVLMVMLLSAETGAPTSVTLQNFDSGHACRVAQKAVTQQCKAIDIDGGSTRVCFVYPNVRAECLKTK